MAGTQDSPYYRGRPAKVKHFACEERVYEGAMLRAKEMGLSLSDVLRAGLQEYVDAAPAAPGRTTPRELMHQGLRATAGRGDDLSAYMAALAAEGWSLANIAQGMVDAGLADTFSRQAVSGRVRKAPFPRPEGLPPVPGRGTRRRWHSAQFDGRYPRLQGAVREVSYRVDAALYAEAAAKARDEGAMFYAVQQDILARFSAGAFSPADVITD